MSIPIPYIGTIGFQDHAKSRLSYSSRGAYITAVIIGLFLMEIEQTMRELNPILHIDSVICKPLHHIAYIVVPLRLELRFLP